MTTDRPATISARGYLVGGVAGTFLSGFAAVLGAAIIAHTGGGFLLLYLLVGGWILGGIVTVVAIPCSFATTSAKPNIFLHPAILPCLIAFIGGAVGPHIGQRMLEAQNRRLRHARALAQAEFDKYYALIRADRQVVFREGWLSLTDTRGVAAIQSLSDGAMNYTIDELDRALSENWRATTAYQNPRCTPEFLARHLPGAWERARNVEYESLAVIVSNTNTPLDLIMRVAYSRELPWGAVRRARDSVRKLTGIEFKD